MKKVIAYVHTHWDREWYREFEEFRLRLIEVFDEVLKNLETEELPYFYFDGQTAALEDYLEIRPEKLAKIKELIKQKKLRIGPFYCSSDSFLVSGELLCRNLELGLSKAKEFGETEFIGYLSDTFGHSQCIPSILKAYNIDKACLWRGLGSLPADINWQDIKTTYLIQGYFQDFLNTTLPIEKKAEALKKYIDKIAQKSKDYILLPIGADHLAIAKNLKKQIEDLNKIYKDYKIEIKTPFEYFEKIKSRTKVNGEFLNNELNFILPGVYSSRIYIKQANAHSQWLLNKIAEPLQALSYFYFGTTTKQNEINHAYKTLIKNHAHDSIYGCSIDEVHDEMLTRFKKTDTISNGIIKRTIRDLSQNNAPLSVINLSNFNYSGKIKIQTEQKLPKWMNAIKISSQKGFTDNKLYNIQEIPITEDITDINEYLIDVKNLDSFSLTQIKKENICNEKYIKTTKNSIENKNIKIEIKNNKINITDKKRNEEYKNIITISDRADIGDSYNFGALKNDTPINAILNKYEIKESNQQRAIIKLSYTINIPATSNLKGRNKTTKTHKLDLFITLYNQNEFAEFEINWENKSKNHILQIGFNLKNKITKTINEDLFGTVERNFNADYDIYKYIPAPKGKELKYNTSPMQRFMSAQNFALITKGNCEYEINKQTINLTLLRATGIISNPINPTRGTPAGPPLKTPKLQCIGQNKANFAIAFTNEEKDLFRLTEEFYSAYVPLFSNLKNKKFDIKTKDLIYSILNENDNLRIRTYNTTTKEIKNIVIKD